MSPGRTLKKKANVEGLVAVAARPLPEGKFWPSVNVPLMPAPLASVTWVLPEVPNELPLVAMANT